MFRIVENLSSRTQMIRPALSVATIVLSVLTLTLVSNAEENLFSGRASVSKAVQPVKDTSMMPPSEPVLNVTVNSIVIPVRTVPVVPVALTDSS